MEKKQVIAIGIGLQTQVLKTCPVHHKIYFNDEANPAGAFALAIELVRKHKPYVEEFHDDEHALTDLLSDTFGSTPPCCPECQASANLPSSASLDAVRDRRRFAESALEVL
ncbi:MAG TPA: hypothetical protein VHS76_00805 [Steroidobacteraceae bacterium]|jgi:hypothetical protein|nr:hypothetical protein [Steroidobacteraceae bacterium]